MPRFDRRHLLAGVIALGTAAAFSPLGDVSLGSSKPDALDVATVSAATDPKAVYTRYIDEVVNGGNLDAIDEVFTEDYAPQTAEPGDLPGREAFKQRMATNSADRRAMMPDAVLVIDRLITDGETVAARQRWTGVNLGDVNELMVLTFVTMRAGQIAQLWTLEDTPWSF